MGLFPEIAFQAQARRIVTLEPPAGWEASVQITAVRPRDRFATQVIGKLQQYVTEELNRES